MCHGPGPTNASRRTSSNARSNRGSAEPLATAIMVAKKPLMSSRLALFFPGMAQNAVETSARYQMMPPETGPDRQPLASLPDRRFNDAYRASVEKGLGSFGLPAN